MRSTSLERLARRNGLQLKYRDALGTERFAPPDSLRAILNGMGVPASTDAEVRRSLATGDAEPWLEAMPRTITPRRDWTIDLAVPHGTARIQLTLDLEDGSSRTHDATVQPLARATVGGTRFLRGRARLPDGLPIGIHRLRVAAKGLDASSHLLVAPQSCYIPDDMRRGTRRWGTAVQLYALQSARSWGVGDLGDLADFAALSAAKGASVVGLNPLHALFPADPGHFGPYGPSSRAFLNGIYIAVDRVPEFAQSAAARQIAASSEFGLRLQYARGTELVDYPAVSALKMPVLEKLHAQFRSNWTSDPHNARAQAYRQFQAGMGTALHDHAVFDALHEHFFRMDHGLWDWHRWPEPFRNKDSEEVRQFAEKNAERVDFFTWLQWEADNQLSAAQTKAKAAGMALGLYLDIAVASHPGGSMAWSFPTAMINGVSVGAPPDEINPLGQTWGSAAFSPRGLRATGYVPLRASVQASMRHAGAVRIDHVMSMQRLYCVPDGMRATDGAYVHYPCAEMRGVVALESYRSQCLVIGEDLGTVPYGFRERMADAGALSYKVYYFERDRDGAFQRPERFAPQALITATTHDLPTLAGYWRGRDLDWRDKLNFYRTPEERPQARTDRDHDKRRIVRSLADLGLLPPGVTAASDMTPQLVAAIYAALARSPSMLLMVQAEDLIGDVEQANLPGTFNEHPNWRRRLSVPVEQLADRMEAIAVAVNREGR
jgi:4-alpha-glucanotransferase